MTTVGYGDIIPVSFAGRLTGASAAIMGILCMSFPVPVFVSHFNYLYNLEKRECKISPQDLQGDQPADKSTLEKFEKDLRYAIIHTVSTIASKKKSASNPKKSGSNASHIWNETRKANPNRGERFKRMNSNL